MGSSGDAMRKGGGDAGTHPVHRTSRETRPFPQGVRCARHLQSIRLQHGQGRITGHPPGNQPLSRTCQCRALWGHEPSQGLLPTFLRELQPAPFTDEETGSAWKELVQSYITGSGLTGFDSRSGRTSVKCLEQGEGCHGQELSPTPGQNMSQTHGQPTRGMVGG